ncbi:MAG TPA: adenylate/guanylate cyclase domain-containing protein [Xanthobacteraceae bacterium]|nr:adenylate/guanylate cyclase domain-containing protein [Xanthobacteraceae bacterium]
MATTKTCPSCASNIPGDSKFCPQCGTPQALPCAACGHANAAGSRFCAQCGTKLGAVPAAAPPPPVSAPAAPPRPANLAERRQITVMFCDLVGSTALSTQLDPEDLREVIAAYHKCTAETVTRFGGYVAKYMGDGVLVYFGYPEAHEDDAENSIRAALALTDAVGEQFDPGRTQPRPQVRVGIATGLVVVGELIGAGEVQERNVVGETPNLAARLQAAAAPNTAVIDAMTRRLARDLFEYETIMPAALKGFAEPVAAWRVLRERTIASRFEALRAESRTPLIGRQEEIELLQRRWAQIKEGEGRVVLLAGEPGIGKSRLTAALEDGLKGETHVCLRYFCQPHHQGSALQPVIAQFQHAADFAPNDSPDVKRAKIENLLAATSGDVPGDDDTAAILELLGLADARRDGASDPQRSRRLLMNALIKRLEALARKTPILMLFEDMHWADPTSLDLLTLTIEHLQKLPVLLIVTFRPEYQPPWTGQPHVTMLTLNRLSQRERAALVTHITGGKALPSDLLDQIVDRTDGVPLFVEELTKAVLESEQLQEAGDQYVLDQPAQPLAIPSTLQGSLMARVDRLGSAREVLQIGAAIGRQFSYELVAAVAGLPDAVLQDALARLAEAELVFMRGTPPNATYVFKHALVQDSAYSAMLRARRQNLHTSIAMILEKRFPETVKTTPEVLAQQFELAGQSEKAIAYWRQAGERDLRRFAMKESIAHYTSALRVVTAMPQSQQSGEVELGVRLGLGLAAMMARGPAAPEAVAHYREALSLSQKLPHCGRERFLATWGVWFGAMVGGRSAEIEPLAEQLVTIAHELGNPDLLLEAYHCKVPMTMRKPDFAAACEAAEEVIRIYDRERHRDHAYYFGGHDSRMCARSFYAQALWGKGLLDQAHDMAWKAIDDARALGHTFSIAHGLQRGGLTMMLIGDTDGCRVIADELYLLAERNKFPWQLSDASFLRGWLATLAGNTETGIGQMRHAAKQPYNPGYRAVFLLHLAERELALGEIDVAAATIEQASAEMQMHANYFCLPDALRLRGEALIARSRDNGAIAEQMFREALTLATTQSCRPLVLRSAMSLARRMAGTERRTAARDLLAPIYATFTEGFARPDLQAAKMLLSELQ